MTLTRELPFTLGDVLVEPPVCRVTIRGHSQQVEPKVMQVLVALHHRIGQVVPRSELHESCWSGRTVSDDSLNRALSAIRRISEQSGPCGFNLRTVPKVGYSLQTSSLGPSPEIVLAVLPFQSAHADPESSWLSDGLAAEVLETLARCTSIRVIGRSSSFQFRGNDKAVSVVKAALRVTHVLDGSVQRESDRTRVSIQLIEAEKETIVWSQRIEEQGDDMMLLGERLAEQVAVALDRTIAASARPSRIDPRAYEFFLRGAELTRDIKPASQARAVALLAECVHLAPDFADGLGALALARAQLGFFQEQSEQSRMQACAEAHHALELDPHCEPARLVPYVGGPVFDFSQHRDFALPSRSAHGRSASPDVSFGVQLLEQGRSAEALEFFEEAERYDPFFQIRVFYHSLALLCEGRERDGLTKLDEAARRWPNLPFFLAARVRWAAAVGDWQTVERVEASSSIFNDLLGSRAADVRAWVEFNRAWMPTFEQFLSLRRQAVAANRSGLEELLLYARVAGVQEVLAQLDAKDEIVVNAQAGRRPDEIGAIALWLPLYGAVRESPEFGLLTDRIFSSE